MATRFLGWQGANLIKKKQYWGQGGENVRVQSDLEREDRFNLYSCSTIIIIITTRRR